VATSVDGGCGCKKEDDEDDFCGGNGSQTNMAAARLGGQKSNNKTFLMHF